jgi:hypothetical protein
VLLAVIGLRWLEHLRVRANDQKDYVVIEIQAALGNSKHIIPVLVNDAQMPSEESLPEGIGRFARLQAFELRPGQFDQDVQTLVKKIKALPIPPPLTRLRRLLEMHANTETTTDYAEVASILNISNPVLFRYLGEIADEDTKSNDPLLSVLVVNRRTGIPGDKFFEDYTHLPKTATTEERRATFARERDAVFSRYKADKTRIVISGSDV